jgi:hypothetical protein
MEPEPGNPQEVEGVPNPAAIRGPDGDLYPGELTSPILPSVHSSSVIFPFLWKDKHEEE